MSLTDQHQQLTEIHARTGALMGLLDPPAGETKADQILERLDQIGRALINVSERLNAVEKQISQLRG
jgi:hypothetical protein